MKLLSLASSWLQVFVEARLPSVSQHAETALISSSLSGSKALNYEFRGDCYQSPEGQICFSIINFYVFCASIYALRLIGALKAFCKRLFEAPCYC